MFCQLPSGVKVFSSYFSPTLFQGVRTGSHSRGGGTPRAEIGAPSHACVHLGACVWGSSGGGRGVLVHSADPSASSSLTQFSFVCCLEPSALLDARVLVSPVLRPGERGCQGSSGAPEDGSWQAHCAGSGGLRWEWGAAPSAGRSGRCVRSVAGQLLGPSAPGRGLGRHPQQAVGCQLSHGSQ